MKRYLVDTNVLSELLRKQPDPKVMGRFDSLSPARLIACEITRLELRYGAELHPNGKALWKQIETSLLPRVTWQAFDQASALAAGSLLARMKQAGNLIGSWDTCLAGTALAHRLVMVTRNTKHFARVPGLEVENWFHQ